jgi:hypothetical protein
MQWRALRCPPLKAAQAAVIGIRVLPRRTMGAARQSRHKIETDCSA